MKAIASFAVVLVAACIGTTGGQIVDFPAAAAGAADATSPFLFDETTIAGHTWHVTLTTATLHIGAAYLDQALPISGAGDTNCILPGTYTAEVLGTSSDGGLDGLDVDLLSPTPQLFPSPGHGTTAPALAAQVWLTGGDVNAITDDTKILVVAGSASDDGGATFPFEGTITIGNNRVPSDVTTGANPPCKQRIVSPIGTTTSVQTTGGLLLRVDAKALFTNVDFSQLTKFSSTYGFSDDPTSTEYTQPSINLWTNLRSAGTYTFAWSPSL
ncbi:MAG TPA: hypothetical protein VH054_18570 [Polyangiaceae bacterium]|nr:hypothetical protein [Polyangiaceae bacterium]